MITVETPTPIPAVIAHNISMLARMLVMAVEDKNTPAINRYVNSLGEQLNKMVEAQRTKS